MFSILNLSNAQKRIIHHDKGHLQVIAGPGSGKTETVSRRIAKLIGKGVDPSTILAFTFTEKAAEELKLRIGKMLREQNGTQKSSYGDMYVGTIDSFCLYILKKLKPEYRSFEILDQSKRIAFVQRWYNDIGLNDIADKQKLGFFDVISTFCDSVDRVMIERVDTSKITNQEFVASYNKYIKKLDDEKFFDFTSVIFRLLDVLNNNEGEILQELGQIKHIVFDEYQDVNKLQEELLNFLSKKSNSVCVVGDDDQNIFQWRGSNIEYIKNFDSTYSNYGISKEHLDINYRATDALIELSNKLIYNNTNRISKNIQAHKNQNRQFEKGDIVYQHFDTDEDEFTFIAQNIKNLYQTSFIDKYKRRYSLSYRDMAILVRTNNDAMRIMKFFQKKDIPIISSNSSSVFKHPLIQFVFDCISYVFGCPAYDNNDVPTLNDIEQKAGDIKFDIPTNFGSKLEEIRTIADSITQQHDGWLQKSKLKLQDFFRFILYAMGIEEHKTNVLRDDDLYHLAILNTAIADFEYVRKSLKTQNVYYLKWFVLSLDKSNYSDPNSKHTTSVDAVRVLTTWKAKGLEFPVVFIPTFVTTKSPPSKKYFVDDNLYEQNRYEQNMEDARRAYYVAITRSQKYLFLTGAKKRTIVVPPQKPSINEIKPHLFIQEMLTNKVETSPSIPPPPKPKSTEPPIQQTAGTFHTSYSELSIYDRCPYEYKLRHVLGFKVIFPPAYGYGNSIHNILNSIHSEYIRNKTIPDDTEIKNIFDKMFYLRFAPEYLKNNMKKSGIKIVKNYLDKYKDRFEEMLEPEKRFEVELGQALISGSIDLLKKSSDPNNQNQSLVEIIDFKTDVSSKNGYAIDHSEQVKLYAYAIEMASGYAPKQAMIYNLSEEKQTIIDITDTVLDETKNNTLQKVENIIKEKFDAQPDESKCKACDFQSICSKKGYVVGTSNIPESLKKVSESATPIKNGHTQSLSPPIVTETIKKRAQKLANDGHVTKNGATFRVESGSEPDKYYNITDGRCSCEGFTKYSHRHPNAQPTCSHVEATKIWTKMQTEQ